VATEKSAIWQFSKKDILEFAAAVQPRISCMCRHVSQAMLKDRKPSWLVTIERGTAPPLECAFERAEAKPLEALKAPLEALEAPLDATVRSPVKVRGSRKVCARQKLL
jgi:hypothetical protein